MDFKEILILETETSTKSYDKIDCGGSGFYQVGSSCYTFTFYRSLTFQEAAEFCEVLDWTGLKSEV